MFPIGPDMDRKQTDRQHTVRWISTALIVGVTAVWPGSAAAAVDPVSNWNSVAVQAVLTAGQNNIVSSRTLAIAQVAIHDALNAIDSRYERYAFTGDAQIGASADAAIAAAARDAIVGAITVGSFPGFGLPANQALAVAQVDAAYATALAGIPDGTPKDDGIAIGQAAALAILALRSTDPFTTLVTYTPGTEPGDWQPTPNPDPPNPPAAADYLPAALPGWGQVTPFVLRQSAQFEPDGPPRLSGERYARDYNEVKDIGEKNSETLRLRTAEQTSIARFWYEGSPAGWSRIVRVVAESQGLDSWDTARLLALVNLAMADGFIAGFKTKYDFNFWRPVTAIRAGDTDGNDATVADPSWSTLLNTPAVPDYTSTHSVLGGAASAVLRRFFRDDDIAFTVTSGVPFAGLTRSFTSFSQAAAENGDSRIYAGIHFRSAVEDGIAQGAKIGRFVFQHALQRLDSDHPVRADNHYSSKRSLAERRQH
jgi:PAP2 superfamily